MRPISIQNKHKRLSSALRMLYTSFCRALIAKQSASAQAMFSTSIFVVEADLRDKPATHDSSSNRSNSNSNNIDTEAMPPTPSTKNNKAPVKTTSSHCFLSAPIPKPEPVPEPPTSETVDDALGPKPEPISRPPTPPVSWKVLWASLSAPTNPAV
ncbi:hypothetical protein KCU81_g8616, partial [Aureobasidium melanogenum]|uniref:Uncharacterized protein n=1 Tax=Aureobasidium melanogenum (strain CBS 110374) TaxID=1043003 RepID=A0A074VUG9_AURM1